MKIKDNKLKKISAGLIISLMLITLIFNSDVSTSRIYAYENDGDFTPSPAPVIGEVFTGVWCGHCPYALGALEIIQLTRFSRDEFFYLAYHYNDTMAISEGNERVNFYKIKGFPSLVIGGTSNPIHDRDDAEIAAIGYGNAIEEVIKKKNYIAQIALSGSLENNEFTVKVLSKEDFGKRNINMIAVLYEDYVNFEGPNGENFHRYVVRNMPYGGKGRGLKLKKDQIYEETRKFVISTKAKELLGIVVFLQNMDTYEIVGSGVYRFATKPDAVFYWGDNPKTGAIDTTTCKNYLTLKVNDAKDLKEVFLQVKLNNEYFDIIDAKICPEIGKENANLVIDPSRGEVKCTFKEGINGNKQLFSVGVKFKKESDKLKFQLRKFVATDVSGGQIPFVIYDINFICYLKITQNKYDIDNNLSVNNDDLTVLVNCFGTFRKDKDFDRKCDFNKDSRIDINDLVELIANLES